jgi:uncharacterized membrane protein YvbJ
MRDGHNKTALKTSMSNLDACPGCGQAVMSGAMRCPKCGALLKTPEEQMESIQKLRESKSPFPVKGLIKFILFLAVLGAAYYYYGEEITAFVRRLLKS